MRTKKRKCGVRKRVEYMGSYHICDRDPHHVGQHKCGVDYNTCQYKWPRK